MTKKKKIAANYVLILSQSCYFLKEYIRVAHIIERQRVIRKQEEEKVHVLTV